MGNAHNLHATAVAFGPARGVLILGPSGAGKSTLALALIGAGAQLVADDQVMLAPVEGQLYVRAPRATAGLIEARGVGLLRLPNRRLARIVLALDLGLPMDTRLPMAENRTIAGITLPCLAATPTSPFSRAVARYVIGGAQTG